MDTNTVHRAATYTQKSSWSHLRPDGFCVRAIDSANTKLPEGRRIPD
jgi:hypothetical protein